MNTFYFQFIQFTVLNCGLAHFSSRPFNCASSIVFCMTDGKKGKLWIARDFRGKPTLSQICFAVHVRKIRMGKKLSME